jgi:hypothetical protein
VNDRRNASLPQQTEKPAVVAIDKYVIRRKEEVPSRSQKDAEEKHVVLPPTTVMNPSADRLSIATSSGDDSTHLISNESSNRYESFL